MSASDQEQIEKNSLAGRINLLLDRASVPRGLGRQQFFSDRYSISKATTSRIFKNGHIPRRDLLQQIADDHGVSVQWLEFGDEGAIVNFGVPPQVSAKILLHLIEAFEKREISHSDVTQKKLDRLLKHLYTVWTEHGEVTSADVDSALDLMGI